MKQCTRLPLTGDHCNHWKSLETAGDYWRLQEITGDCWRLLEITGKITGDYRKSLELTGDHWRLLLHVHTINQFLCIWQGLEYLVYLIVLVTVRGSEHLSKREPLPGGGKKLMCRDGWVGGGTTPHTKRRQVNYVPNAFTTHHC